MYPFAPLISMVWFPIFAVVELTATETPSNLAVQSVGIVQLAVLLYEPPSAIPVTLGETVKVRENSYPSAPDIVKVWLPTFLYAVPAL